MADGTISIDVELNETAFRSSLENMGAVVKSGADAMIKSVGNLSGSFVLLPDTINSVTGSIPNIINGVISNITGKNPVMTKTGTNFFTSLIGEMPYIISKISDSVPDITNTVFNKFIDFMPGMGNAGSKFFHSLISLMPEIISDISGKVPEITEQILFAVAEGEPQMSEAGFGLFCAITNSLPLALKELLKAPEQITSALMAKFLSLTGQFKTVGENIVYGVWAGISSLGSWLMSNVTGFFKGIVGSVTGFLGISSPSSLFRDLVGKNIAFGVKAGIDGEMPGVINDAAAQMSRLAEAAKQSSRINPGAADILGRSNTAGNIEAQSVLKNLPGSENMSSQTPEINVTLEPTADIRGFFDYIRMGVKRSGYLNGEA